MSFTAIGARYEIALTLKALADTTSPELGDQSMSLLDELGVVTAPAPPLP